MPAARAAVAESVGRVAARAAAGLGEAGSAAWGELGEAFVAVGCPVAWRAAVREMEVWRGGCC